MLSVDIGFIVPYWLIIVAIELQEDGSLMNVMNTKSGSIHFLMVVKMYEMIPNHIILQMIPYNINFKLHDSKFDLGKYAGDAFVNEKYADGETAIVTALRKVIEEDIPKMRPNADKKLLIFTDGRSSEAGFYF